MTAAPLRGRAARELVIGHILSREAVGVLSICTQDPYDLRWSEEKRDVGHLEIRKLATLAGSTRRANLLRQYGDAVPDPFADYLELEELAAQTDIYASQVIPGNLQTSDYAHAVIDGARRWRTERKVRTFTELRMQRTAVLTRRSRSSPSPLARTPRRMGATRSSGSTPAVPSWWWSR
ncbi:hypothetical protein Sgleb_08990 [Streptomyces glebosus]|uniref:DUF5753 domain-containing protein n=1 Tax=Streptomyces glebosus TaxID=249580 RepID=A0A640SPY5_9ACTN|nr:hypothetical protein Sgleb_08990 [Streptomyces glebosus]GHG57757.1 hypothetical protein GCM10010513_21410 [Streptomyces glebosus]